MLLALWMVLTIAILALTVRSVVSDDLGERYTEGLGHAFWIKKKEMTAEDERRNE